MAVRVGSATTASSDGASTSIALPARNVASNERPTVFVKWEINTGTPVVGSATDNVGNDYSVLVQLGAPSGEPGGAWIVADEGFVGDASLVITVNFTGGDAAWRRAVLETWTGLSAIQDDTAETNTGTGTSYSTAALNSSESGLMLAGLAGFTTLTGKTAAGTPTATLGGALTDTFITYLISASAQTITPGASANESNVWKMLAILLRDAPAPPAYGLRQDTQFMHDGGSRTSAIHSLQGWMPLGPEKWFADELESAAGGGGPTYVFNPLSGRGGAAAHPLVRRH